MPPVQNNQPGTGFGSRGKSVGLGPSVTPLGWLSAPRMNARGAIWAHIQINKHKKKHSTKGDPKGKGHRDMSKSKCFNCGEYGHFARDFLKACNNANIAQESERNKKVENMLDLDNISVSKECVMMCTEVTYEDEDVVVYGDQGINTEEYKKAMYGKLTKTQRKEEEEVQCNVALCTNHSVSLERKRR